MHMRAHMFIVSPPDSEVLQTLEQGFHLSVGFYSIRPEIQDILNGQ